MHVDNGTMHLKNATLIEADGAWGHAPRLSVLTLVEKYCPMIKTLLSYFLIANKVGL
jgi:hypothetical protein